MKAEDFLTKYERALRSQDWEVVRPLIHDDACVTFSDGSRYIGKVEIQAAFERNFSLIEDEVYQISDVHWVMRSTDHAVCMYDFHWQGRVRGRPARGVGRGTMVIVKVNGRWILIAEHLGNK